MKAFKYFFLFILMLTIGISIYVATLKSSYNISETRTINAPVEVVFKYVNDLKNWKNWGPWHETDANIVASFPEKTSGVGASFNWTGKNGDGSIKTISLVLNKEIIQQANLGSNTPSQIYWNFKVENNKTNVTWGMKGKNTFSEKATWLKKGGIEKNIKPIITRGLELLEKSVFENMNTHSIAYKNEVELGGGFYMYQITSCSVSESQEFMTNSFKEILSFMNEHSIAISGTPFTITHEIDVENKIVQFSTCIPVKERVAPVKNILTGYLAPQKALKVVFYGHYKFLEQTRPAIYKNIYKEGFTPIKKGHSIEYYTVGPNDSKNPADWMTEIYIPLENN